MQQLPRIHQEAALQAEPDPTGIRGGALRGTPVRTICQETALQAEPDPTGIRGGALRGTPVKTILTLSLLQHLSLNLLHHLSLAMRLLPYPLWTSSVMYTNSESRKRPPSRHMKGARPKTRTAKQQSPRGRGC